MGKFDKFSSKSLVEQGAKLYLLGADGAATDEWIIFVNKDSKRYAEAKLAYDRMSLEGKCKAGSEAFIKHVLSACVTEWSLEEECTAENVAELLDVSPHNASMLETFVFNIQGFLTLARLLSSEKQSEKTASLEK